MTKKFSEMLSDHFNSVDFDEVIDQSIKRGRYNRITYLLYKLDKARFSKHMDTVFLEISTETQAQWNSAVVIRGLTDEEHS